MLEKGILIVVGQKASLKYGRKWTFLKNLEQIAYYKRCLSLDV